ncbi:MAG TPA: AAA family ATPase [Thermoanaerobaculia bacterium]|nr:AAA family ATPase [Thermoanaerobaculia bacterium]
MVVFVNGAFGVGKTEVSRLLVRRLRGATLYDPEPAGVLLQRLRALTRRPVSDFQDLPSWRRATVRGIRLARAVRRVVVVPMAFSNLEYLREVREGVRRFDGDVRHFCLVAPLAVVLDRLARRSLGSPADVEWQRTRAAECCAAHRGEEFAEHVSTDRVDPSEVAARVLARIRP